MMPNYYILKHETQIVYCHDLTPNKKLNTVQMFAHSLHPSGTGKIIRKRVKG